MLKTYVTQELICNVSLHGGSRYVDFITVKVLKAQQWTSVLYDGIEMYFKPITS